MRTTFFSASVLALMAGVGSASAADIITYDPAPTAPPIYSPTQAANWTGPYMGAVGGYGWGSGTVGHRGWLGGAYAGYNFQTSPNVVVGLEGDVTFTGKSGTSGGVKAANPWNSTIRGRVGYTFDRTMVYATGGVAIGGVEANSESATEVGFTAGVGAEALLTEKLIGRAELRYTDYGSHTFPGAGSVSYKSTDAMVGLGVRF